MKPRGYESATIDRIKPDVLAAIRGLKTSRQWPLLLSGDVGTGKTCAAACLYGGFRKLPMWHRADDLLLSMALGRTAGVQIESMNELGEINRREIPYHTFVARVTGACCLFLDDLGTRKPTEAMYQALFDVLEYRKGKPLCVTTNKTVRELATMYDDRIADRFASGTVIKFTGKSLRQRGGVVNA